MKPLKSEAIGKNIKARREELRLKKEDFAKQVNISLEALNTYESGSRIPRDEVKARIAEALGKPAETLFYNWAG